MTWKKITEKNTIVPGKGEEFDMDGKKIAVFNQNGYHALDAILSLIHISEPTRPLYIS